MENLSTAPSRRGFTARETGFTLIELMVILVILSVFALILVPILRPLHRTHSSVDASREKWVVISCLQYMEDYDGRFPPVVGYTKIPAGPHIPRGEKPVVVAQNW